MNLLSRVSLILMVAAPAAVHAQVIEIDSSGEARTFDGPTLFVDSDPVRIDRSRVSVSTIDTRARIALEARNHGLAPGLLEAVAWQESRGRMGAVSVKGALGVMQLMPGTATELGVNPADLADNIRGGALYLRRQLDRFKGNVPLALAAYNAGPGAVARYGGVPPYRETRDYVAKIMDRWQPLVAVTTIAATPASVNFMIEVP